MPRKALVKTRWLCLMLLSGCQHLSPLPCNDLQHFCDTAVARLEPHEAPPSTASGVDVDQAQGRALLAALQANFAEPQADDTLTLADVILSVYETYPLFEAALRERDIAAGKELAAWGEFDTGLKAYSVTNPMGFYKRYRTTALVDQPLFGGGSLQGRYKIGRGSFNSAWYDDQTNLGGEFALSMAVPLLKDRLIDKRRSGVFQAGLARQAVEPAVQAQWLAFVRDASQTYWYWVETGQVLQAHRQLLRLAEDRVEQIEQRVLAGDLERIARIDNQRLIALRETKVIESQRKLQAAAIKLSLFVRTPDGRPQLPDGLLLPHSFPSFAPPDIDQMPQDIQMALASRPELVELDLVLQQVRIELAQAENTLLPKLDAVVGASQDVGAPINEKRTKSPFELEAGVYGEVPLQRREARGKILAARGKLTQLTAKREFVVDKIVAEVQDALSALEAASGQIEQSAKNLELSREALELGREAFNAGDIDLIVLNIYEQAVADAAIAWIEAQAYYFAAQADYQAALARNPFVADAP
jgi:outer membrane protein TolC